MTMALPALSDDAPVHPPVPRLRGQVGRIGDDDVRQAIDMVDTSPLVVRRGFD